MNQPRILVHAGMYDPAAMDGVAMTVVGQTEGLFSLGLDIEIWQFRGDVTEIIETRTDSGIPVFTLPRFKNQFLAAIRVPTITRKWIKRRVPEIQLLHLHSVFSPSNNYLANLGIPFAVTPNGGWAPRVLHGRKAALKKIWINLFEKRLWRRARFVQAVSAFEKADLEQLPGVRKVEQIPNGVFIPVPPGSSPDRRKTWLFLGRLAIDQKGLDTLLNAYAKVTSGSDDVPILRLAGPDFRDSLSALQQMTEKLGIAHKVEFTGPLKGVYKQKAFDEACLFLHPSRWEGMPLAILEALGQGIPCLVSKETGLGEWIEENNCGWMTPAEMLPLAEMLTRIIQSPGILQEAAKNTRPAVIRDYTWANICRDLASKYGIPKHSSSRLDKTR